MQKNYIACYQAADTAAAQAFAIARNQGLSYSEALAISQLAFRKAWGELT